MKIISPRSTSTVLLLVLLVGTTYKERSNLLGGGGGEGGGSCGGLNGIACNSFKHSLLQGLAYVDQLMLVVTSILTVASTSWPLVLLEMRAQKADILST